MEFLTAFPTWHICEYNNRYTKKCEKRSMEFPESTFLKAARHIQSTETLKVKLKGLTRVYKSKIASIDVSLQKQHSFGDKNE